MQVTYSSASCPNHSKDFNLHVKVSATGTMTSSYLHWTGESGTFRMALTPVNRWSAQGTKTGLAGRRIKWWVVGSSPDGATGQTPIVTTDNPCPP